MHDIRVQSFSTPVKCCHCNLIVWGHNKPARKGVQCKACRIVAHQQCADHIPEICDGHDTQKSFVALSVRPATIVYSFIGQNAGELTIKPGDQLLVVGEPSTTRCRSSLNCTRRARGEMDQRTGWRHGRNYSRSLCEICRRHIPRLGCTDAPCDYNDEYITP